MVEKNILNNYFLFIAVTFDNKTLYTFSIT